VVGEEEGGEMTREQTIEAIRIMQAFVDGKEVESEIPNGCFVKAMTPSWDWFNGNYRIKPTATLRPWTADEVPLGAWIRYKRALHDRSILAWTSNQADRDMWLDEREHSTDGGKTWLPCGVVEEAK
jgi:hypothetical protein